jgi:2,3-bisphosphoglycerate-independent phosphoglycerate mutase
MSALEITEKLAEAIESNKYDAIVCNYANADMVGHTGDFQATIKAIETIDKCLGKVIQSTTKVGGEILITADHGNAEQLRSYDTEKIKSHYHTAHTRNPVPAIYIGRDAKFRPDGGSLSDIAPTMLYLMGLNIPKEMTGKTLLTLK